MSKFLGSHYFYTKWWILFLFGIMIDTGQKFFISTISTHDHDLEVEVTDLEFKC